MEGAAICECGVPCTLVPIPERFEMSILLQNAGAPPGAGLRSLGYSLPFFSTQWLQGSTKSAAAQIHQFYVKYTSLQNNREKFECL